MVTDLLKVDADTDWGTPAANTASRERERASQGASRETKKPPAGMA
jgi:hypothetical protein